MHRQEIAGQALRELFYNYLILLMITKIYGMLKPMDLCTKLQIILYINLEIEKLASHCRYIMLNQLATKDSF